MKTNDSTKTIALGFYGRNNDTRIAKQIAAKNSVPVSRVWRPSLAIVQQPELKIDEYQLLYHSEDEKREAEEIAAEMRQTCRKLDVKLICVPFSDAFNIEEVYLAIKKYAIELCQIHQGEKVKYLIHITNGTHVMQLALFYLTQALYLPGEIVSTRHKPDDKSDYIGSSQIINVDMSSYKTVHEFELAESEDRQTFLKRGIHTQNHRYNRMIEEIEFVAKSCTDPILLQGPTGSGKTELAKQIHELRKKLNLVEDNLISLNCAVIKGEMAYAQLFGAEKGSYTGATKKRVGLIKAADKGTLFLDEIGELGLSEQAMLLRAIEEKKVLPLGSEKEDNCNFTLICGTNRDLSKEVSKGNFRADLLERINMWSYTLPGLNERTEDISPNIDYELAHIDIDPICAFEPSARRKYLEFAQHHTWPGGFRELKKAIHRMAILSSKGLITNKEVVDEISRQNHNTPAAFPLLDRLLPTGYDERYDYCDLVKLNYIVSVCRKSATAAEAGREVFKIAGRNKPHYNYSDQIAKYLDLFSLSFKSVTNV